MKEELKPERKVSSTCLQE